MRPGPFPFRSARSVTERPPGKDQAPLASSLLVTPVTTHAGLGSARSATATLIVIEVIFLFGGHSEVRLGGTDAILGGGVSTARNVRVAVEPSRYSDGFHAWDAVTSYV